MPSDQLEVERDGTARKEGLDGALRWKTCLDGASDGFLSLHINEVVFVKALIVEMSNQPLLVLAHDPR
ncbi:hypothetical protein Y032_0022g634 [Ancylostoma ceylanicum]|nr:hypothetical protein Y032_0022g634 [Ancylostoma ceylanicum]